MIKAPVIAGAFIVRGSSHASSASAPWTDSEQSDALSMSRA